MIRRFLLQKMLQDEIFIVMQVHDQIDTICADKYVEGWGKALQQLMEKAGKVILPSGLLKAEVTIAPFWTK